MARTGIPIPAEVPAVIPAFSSVLADIGDEQSLTANLSTFSGHLRRIQVWIVAFKYEKSLDQCEYAIWENLNSGVVTAVSEVLWGCVLNPKP